MSFISNAVTAKSRAIFGKSFTAEDYTKLSEKSSIADAAAFLKATPRYGAALSGVNPQTVHRGQLEALLEKSIFDIFDSFRRFDHTESGIFFSFIVAQLEAEQILRAIEAVAAGTTDTYISSLPMFLIKHASVDLLELGRADSFLDIDELISRASYGKALHPLLVEAAESGVIHIRECERRIYTSYYMSCFEMIEHSLKGAQKTELKKALLKSVDMVNVVNCYRMRALEEKPADEVKRSLIPFRFRLNDEAIERLAEQSDITRVEAELSRIGYRTGAPARFDTVEQLADKISLDVFRRTLRLSQNAPTVYFCLIECMKIELGNIKTIIEGIRYGLTGSEIMPMLVI